jgi:hypothetical protein
VRERSTVKEKKDGKQKISEYIAAGRVGGRCTGVIADDQSVGRVRQHHGASRLDGSSVPGHIEYRYTTFDGVERKTFRAEAGQTTTFDCDVTVEKGTLLLQVVAPDGESLWEETFRQDTADTVTLTASQNGFHTVRIEGKATGGSFDISWSVGE